LILVLITVIKLPILYSVLDENVGFNHSAG